MKFRDLRADEIECRVALCKENGVSLLLYKDARCDMNILDETVGAMNWKREHSRDNANCTVSIWDEDKKQWVGKEDTGTESNTEAEKGLASDSFKRSCFNWGIGRELYTAPFIWVTDCEIYKSSNGKPKCKTTFKVKDITIVDKKITALVIADNYGNVVYTMGKQAPKKEYVCSCCGKPFKEQTIDGKTYSAKTQYEAIQKKHPGELVKCAECRAKEN